MTHPRGATSQKAGFNSSFIYREFATIKNQAYVKSYNIGAEFVPEASAEEFSVVLRGGVQHLALGNSSQITKRRDALIGPDFYECSLTTGTQT